MSNTDDTSKASKVEAPKPVHEEPGVTIYDDEAPEAKTVKSKKSGAGKTPAKG